MTSSMRDENLLYRSSTLTLLSVTKINWRKTNFLPCIVKGEPASVALSSFHAKHPAWGLQVKVRIPPGP
jgi:hypothetical protein